MNKNKKNFKDTEIALFMFIISASIFIYFDAFDLLHQVTRDYEELEIDELITLLFPASIILTWYSFRKTQQSQYFLEKSIISNEIDSMTKLSSHFSFNERCKPPNINNYLVVLNINNFKDIHNSFETEFVDLAIKKIALRLQESLSKHTEEKLYRLHGDEFAFFYNGTKKEILEIITQVEFEFTKDSFSLNDINIFMNINISYSNVFPQFQTAKIAMQEAKKSLNTPIVEYTKSMSKHESAKENLSTLSMLNEAKDKDQFTLVYQPIINNANNKTDKYEALIRIKKDDRLISPYIFLELSKKFKLYPYITKFVIDESFKTFQNRDEEFSINLSYLDINNNFIKTYLLDKVKSNPITASRLVIEIVESENFSYCKNIVDFRNELYNYGIKLAIDDFGSGYSNWINVLKLKPNYIKIDGSLIKELNTNKDNYSLIESIIIFAKKNNIKTIAEFISTKELYETVKDMGIDFSQGYYFSEPKELS